MKRELGAIVNESSQRFLQLDVKKIPVTLGNYISLYKSHTYRYFGGPQSINGKVCLDEPAVMRSRTICSHYAVN